MASICIRCGGCKCNNSCGCTAEQIMDYLRDNNLPLTTQQYVREKRKDNPVERIKEIEELDLSEYEGLARNEAIRKFLLDTGKAYISRRELKILGF